MHLQWPQTSEVVFPDDSEKMMLTNQQLIVRHVIQSSFPILHASIAFTCAFPDADNVIMLIKHALIEAATDNLPVTSVILSWLQNDPFYVADMAILVSVSYVL